MTVAPWAGADLCFAAPPVWARDGSLRWFGSRARGADAQAEVGIAAGDDLGVTAVTAAERAAASASQAPSSLSGAATGASAPSCPPDMVVVAEAYCVDRFEARLVDARDGSQLPFDFAVSSDTMRWALADWSDGRTRGDLHARALALPALPAWTNVTAPPVRAESRAGVAPSAFVSGTVAASACQTAGKRLCTRRELNTACRGKADTLYPYGPTYRAGACNLARSRHPAAWLHDSAAVGHLDPRLVHVADGDGPLLRKTGSTPSCASRWGDDAIFDLVGNLDEWLADADGAFAGGAFMRRTNSGCSALVRGHPKHYLDYSTGFRCCKDLIARE